MKRLFKKHELFKPSSFGYTDTKESLIDLEAFSDRYKKKIKSVLNNMLKPKEKFKKLKNNKEKIKFLYKLYISNLEKAGYCLEHSNTPNEIVDKIEDMNQFKLGRKINKAYYPVRYGDKELVDSELTVIKEELM